jgi:hypothetical protein
MMSESEGAFDLTREYGPEWHHSVSHAAPSIHQDDEPIHWSVVATYSLIIAGFTNLLVAIFFL